MTYSIITNRHTLQAIVANRAESDFHSRAAWRKRWDEGLDKGGRRAEASSDFPFWDTQVYSFLSLATVYSKCSLISNNYPANDQLKVWYRVTMYVCLSCLWVELCHLTQS